MQTRSSKPNAIPQRRGAAARFAIMAWALLCLVLAVTGLVGAAPAGAEEAPAVFTASGGMSAGVAVSTGTPLTFAVTAEPEGGGSGTVQVGDGSNAAADLSYNGRVVIPQTVEANGKRYDVTSVARYALRFSQLSAVQLPNTLETVEEQAFYACYNMAALEFAGTPGLRDVGKKAFQLPQCRDGLKELRIPASVERIRERAFSGQASLVEIRFEGGSVASLADYAFANCQGAVYAEVPAVRDEYSGLGVGVFRNCTALKTVRFLGGIASASSYMLGTQTFVECTQLQEVVYCGKRYIPTFRRYGGGGSTDEPAPTFADSDPLLYYTVSYYASAEDARRETEPLGFVRVRSDTRLLDVRPGMAGRDEAGAVVYEGAALSPLAGFDAWAYEGSPDLSAPVPDSLHAYPASSKDLGAGTAMLEQDRLLYTGGDIMPRPKVIDALGTELQEGVDYELEYRRLDDDGAPAAGSDLSACGRYRVSARGIGAYTGSAAAEYEVAQAQVGTCFAVDGVTYCVTKLPEGAACGEVSVGDGSAHAAGDDCTAVQVPAQVKIPGSQIAFDVTAIAARAFGGDSEQSACALLERVELPDGVGSIGLYAFGFCTSLETVEVPASVEEVGPRAFQNCVSLSELSFASQERRSIGSYAFAYCTSLSRLELPACTLQGRAFFSCVKLSRIDFAGAVGTDGADAFGGCKRLGTVVFHGSAWSGQFAQNTMCYRVLSASSKKVLLVRSAAALKSVTVPASVKVGGKAFAVCGIAKKAFSNAKATTVTVLSKKLTKAQVKGSLKDSKVKTVKVPASKLKAYKKYFAKTNAGKKATVKAV